MGWVTRLAFAIVALPALPALANPFGMDEIMDSEVMIRPPFERYCLGPTPWAAVVKCAKLRQPNVKFLAKPSTSTQLVRLAPYQTFLYARSANDTWRMVMTLTDENYEVAEERTVKLQNRPFLRLDLRHRVEIRIDAGHGDVLTERIALVCPDAGPYCQRVVYACTVLSHGHAVETFRGDVTIADDGTVRAEGDRSLSGPRCTGR